MYNLEHILVLSRLLIFLLSSSPVFILLLLAYIFTKGCNIGLVIVISTEKNLHHPMHFLFCNLPLNDILGTTVIMPRLLQDILRETSERYMTYVDCVVQVYFVHVFAAASHYVLMIMAFDRYVAICNPLRYSAIMTNKMVVKLSALAWGVSFCDNASLFLFVADSVAINNVYGIISTVVILIFSLGSVFITYGKIAAVCITSKNKALNSKAIKTCGKHIAVYIIISLEYSENRKLASVMFHIVPPGLNLLVYGLKNQRDKTKDF
uniref:G-protein coupled receptors family 1 profile domain-containing protein n=1 Tax=Sinocyclocheilus grahami TaxID=75366 RepID=A0A672MTS5_SINGR